MHLMMNEILHFKSFAEEAIQKTRALILEISSKGFNREVKKDQSFVTDADLEVEQLLRKEIAARFPEHGIIGEEFPNSNPESQLQWVIDPIDGTQNFAHGIPTYGTILGLQQNGETLVGAIDHPALNLTYVAYKGGGVTKNGIKLPKLPSSQRESKNLDPNDILGVSTRGMFDRSGDGPVFEHLTKSHGSHRIYYDIYSTSLTIEGRMAVMVEFNCALWDISATKLMIEEQGGVYHLVKRTHFPDQPERFSAVYGQKDAVEAVLLLLKECSDLI